MRRYNNFLPVMLLACGAVSMVAQIPLSSGVSGPLPQQTIPTGVSGLPAANTGTSVTGAPAILGPGDLLEFTVFGIPELTQRLRVDNDGRIHLALVGDVDVAGKSPESARDQITERLVSGHFVKNPQVQLYIIEFSGQIAYITGEVNRPGAYSLLRSHRLADLIAFAGGLTPRAGTSVSVVHNGDTKNALHLSLDDQDDDRKNPVIEPGDSINVALTGIVYVLGNVEHPGGFLLDHRTTLSFMQALALAEGPSSSGSITKAVLIHSAQPDSPPIPVNLKHILEARSPDIQLQAGDIIWIGDSATRNLGRLALQTILATASGVAIYSSYVH